MRCMVDVPIQGYSRALLSVVRSLALCFDEIAVWIDIRGRSAMNENNGVGSHMMDV